METRRPADLCGDDSLRGFMLYPKSIIVVSFCPKGERLADDPFIWYLSGPGYFGSIFRTIFAAALL